MPCSRSCRRVLVAFLLAAACLSAGGALTAAAAATLATSPAAQPDPARPPAATPKPTATAPVAVATYTVRAGDNLSVIAMGHRYPGGWPRLYAHNRITLGPDPDLIHAGQVLELPSLSPTPSRKPAPTTRPTEVTPAKASAASSVPQPLGTAAGSGPSPGWGLVAPAGVMLAILGLGLAARIVPGRRQGHSQRPITSSRPGPERRPVPVNHPSHPPQGPTQGPRQGPTQGPTPQPTSLTDPPWGRRPTGAAPKRPVSFSLVVVADSQRGEDLAALLLQLGGLDHPRLGIVVVIGQDDQAAWSAAEAAARRIPGRITLVTDPQHPRNAATAIDSALPACHGEVTGVLGATKMVHPQLLDRVAGHVRDNDATMIRIGAQLQSCWWSSSPTPGRFRLRLVPGRGELAFVPTQLLRTQASQDQHPTRPTPGPGHAPNDQLRLHLTRLRVLRNTADTHLQSQADPQQPDGFIRLLLAELDAVDRLGGELLDTPSRRPAATK